MIGLSALITGSMLPSLLFAFDTTKFEFLSSYLGEPDAYAIPSYEIPTITASEIGSVSPQHFESIVRKGIPTVFRGAGSQWGDMRDLSCADFAARWPDAVMRAEYTGEEEEVFLPLKAEHIWAQSARVPLDVHVPEVECEKDVNAKDSRPIFSPYVLHVKDRVRLSIKQEIGKMYPGLPWATSKLLDAHVRDSMEFWFQQVGAGTFAHNDAYCHSVFSMQLRGAKKWRLMLTPEVERLGRDVFDEFDSGIYDSVHQWEPDFEVILNEGDGILFPPGFMHETRTVAAPFNSTTEDTCGTSVTFNIPLAMPSKLVRTFLSRFSVSRELHQCMGRWESFATLSAKRVFWNTPDPPNSRGHLVQEKELADSVLARVDTNGNGIVELVELETYLTIGDDEDVSIFKARKSIDTGDVYLAFSYGQNITAEMANEAMHIRAVDTMQMWDINEDGFATRAEILQVLEYFHYFKYRQSLVDKAITDKAEDGTVIVFPIGSAPFVRGMEIVDYIMARNMPDGPPVLSPELHAKLTPELVAATPCGEDEL